MLVEMETGAAGMWVQYWDDKIARSGGYASLTDQSMAVIYADAQTKLAQEWVSYNNSVTAMIGDFK